MSRFKVNTEAIKKAVDISGGLKELSKRADVTYQSLLNWKAGRSTPSALNCIKIEQSTNGIVSRRDILPEFPWDETVVKIESETNEALKSQIQNKAE